MWKFGLLAVVVGVATLVATIAIGRPLVDPDDSSETAALTARTRSWGERASDRCRDAIGRVRAELSGATGLTTSAERAVVLFSATTEIEGRLLRLLRTLTVSGAQQPQVDEALDLLEEQYKRDVATTAKLERKYDFALLSREVLVYEQLAAKLRARFRTLGAQGCVAYFDPESYR